VAPERELVCSNFCIFEWLSPLFPQAPAVLLFCTLTEIQ